MLGPKVFRSLLPPIYWILLNIFTGVVLGTPLKWRPFTIPPFILLSVTAFRSISHLPQPFSGAWGVLTMIGIIHCSSLLYVKKWVVGVHDPLEHGDNSGWWWCVKRYTRRMHKVSSNPRLLNIHRELVCPPWGQIVTRPPTRAFRWRRVLNLLLYWAFFIVVLVPTTHICIRSRQDFAPNKQVYIRRLIRQLFWTTEDPVTVRETLLRLCVVAHSFITTIIFVETIHVALAVVSIYLLRVDTVEEWPDLFGSIADGTTIRTFWSRFWHRVHVSAYRDHAHFVISVLPEAGSVVDGRTLVHLLFFLFSGAVHTLTSWQTDGRCADYNDLYFYMANFAAVFFETQVLKGCNHVATRLHARDKHERLKKPTRKGEPNPGTDQNLYEATLLNRCMGYTWVLGFFFWLLPKCYYPRMYCAEPAVA